MNLLLAIKETKVTNPRPEIRIYQDTVSRDKTLCREDVCCHTELSLKGSSLDRYLYNNNIIILICIVPIRSCSKRFTQCSGRCG